MDVAKSGESSKFTLSNSLYVIGGGAIATYVVSRAFPTLTAPLIQSSRRWALLAIGVGSPMLGLYLKPQKGKGLGSEEVKKQKVEQQETNEQKLLEVKYFLESLNPEEKELEILTPKEDEVPADFFTSLAEQKQLEKMTKTWWKGQVKKVKPADFQPEIQVKTEYASDERNGHGYGSIEDKHYTKTIPGVGTLAGVFDGHGGDQTSELVSKKFGGLFVKKLLETPGDVRLAFEEAAIEMENQVKSEIKADAGSTMVFTFVPEQTNMIFTATLGDSEACLINSDGTAYYLSLPVDWNCPKEEKRAKDANCSIMNARIGGALSVSRSFGDEGYKARDNTVNDESKKEKINKWGVLSHNPKVTCTYFSDNPFIILFSDGVSDGYDYLIKKALSKEMAAVIDDMGGLEEALTGLNSTAKYEYNNWHYTDMLVNREDLQEKLGSVEINYSGLVDYIGRISSDIERQKITDLFNNCLLSCFMYKIKTEKIKEVLAKRVIDGLLAKNSKIARKLILEKLAQDSKDETRENLPKKVVAEAKRGWEVGNSRVDDITVVALKLTTGSNKEEK